MRDKKDHNPSKDLMSQERDNNGYIHIESVECHLHSISSSTLYRKLHALYLNRKKRMVSTGDCTVTIFIASGSRIDDKLDNINRRVLKK